MIIQILPIFFWLSTCKDKPNKTKHSSLTHLNFIIVTNLDLLNISLRLSEGDIFDIQLLLVLF